MKNIIIKKIIPFISVFSIILSLFVLPVYADEFDPYRQGIAYFDNSDSAHLNWSSLNWVNLTPGTGFAYYELYNGDLYKKTASPKVGDESDSFCYSYNFRSSTSSVLFKFYNMFFNVNIANPGFQVKKGVNYYICLDLCFPKKYAPNEDLGYVWWPDDCTGGAFSWQSVQYSDKYNYTYQFDNETMNALKPYIQSDYDARHLPDITNYFRNVGNEDELVKMRYFCRIVPNKDTTLKSFGFNLAFTEANVWDGILGIVNFQIGIPKEQVKVDNSGNVFGDYTGQNNTSSNNTSSNNTSSNNTSSGTSSSNNSSDNVSTGPGGTPSNGGNTGSGNTSYGPGGTPSYSPNTSGVASNTFGGDVFTTVGGLEGGIQGNNKGNLNSLFGVFDGFTNSLSGSNSLSKGLTVASGILSKVINIPSFSSILYFSLALGFVAFSLNMVSTFVSSSNKNAINKFKEARKNKNSSSSKKSS